MKKISFFFFAVLVLTGSLTAQSFIGKLNPSPPDAPLKVTELNILAVMVEFQVDDDGVTYGDGTFGSIYTGDNKTAKDIIDPLPHDKQYFENHLYFAKNYYNKVSGGKLNIDFTVFNEIITVDQTMRNYSPPPKSDDLTNVANFAKEVWEKFDAAYGSQINYDDYDVFAVFHAGVGRDVALPGSIGNERDLPSVYLSNKSLKKIYGDSFESYIPGTTNNISHTMILPVTESRELSSVAGKTLLELSINGLIVSSIASHLGLPDLFNTETGLSAIGRFGLMDGQSIFAYGGLFPPEPSPWEKQYLGWIQPIEIKGDRTLVNLVTKLKAEGNDTTYIKVPINSTEYFLIENRVRDANKDGAKLTYFSDGVANIATFVKDTTGFYSYDVDSTRGVVIDVDEYDWAVPGSGILIWHIDEAVIDARYDENGINNNKIQRGVDIEEADGVQDIGERFFTVFGDEVIGEGSDEDLWYSSNEGKIYENRFSYDTNPGTNSNLGGNSLVTIRDFSDTANAMTFWVEYGANDIKLISSAGITPDYNTEKLATVLTPDGDLIGYTVKTAGGFQWFAANGFELASVNDVKEGYAFYLGDDVWIFSLTEGARVTNMAGTKVASANVFDSLASQVAVFKGDDNYKFVVGTQKGSVVVYQFTYTGGDQYSVTVPDQYPSDNNSIINLSFSDPDDISSFIYTTSLGISGDVLSGEEGIVYSALLKSSNDKNAYPYQKEDGSISIIDSDGNKEDVFIASDVMPGEFSVVTGKNNQSGSIAFTAGNTLYKYNMAAAAESNFPVSIADTFSFTGKVLSADVTGDGYEDIFAAVKRGLIYAFDGKNGNVLAGYPLSCGDEIAVNPVITSATGGLYLSVLSENNIITTWRISDRTDHDGWFAEYGINGLNSRYINLQGAGSEYFPEDQAYNWPNPTYDNQTFIRYYVGEDSDIEIKIFDLGGDLVDELKDYASGGFEHETTWDVSGVQTGVYFARLEVNSKNGKSAHKIIKIAVVK